jgi:hypothetical protein
MKPCLFCGEIIDKSSVEHIVPESFGNEHYVLEGGIVCSGCNNRFSESEMKALSNTVFVIERARKAVKSKKGKPAKGKINELKIEGDENFHKGFLYATGLNPDNFLNFDPNTKLAQVFVKGFDKSEVATSKFLLKMGFESFYKSQQSLWRKYDFRDLKEYLTLKSNKDWAFISRNLYELKFCDIPRFTDKYRLTSIHCSLQYYEFNAITLLFKFKFGGVSFVINLLGRDITWIKICKKVDPTIHIFPEHFNKKIEKSGKQKN